MTVDTFWDSVHSLADCSEADVEARLVLPLLRALDWPQDQIHQDVPVERQLGHTSGRHPEADIVVAPTREAQPGYIVVETKKPAVRISGGVLKQARSYSLALGAPYVITTNGVDFALFETPRFGTTCQLLSCQVTELQQHRAEIERRLERSALLTHMAALGLPIAQLGSISLEPFYREILSGAAGTTLTPRTLTNARCGAFVLDGTQPLGLATPEQPIFIKGAAGRGKSTVAALLAQQCLHPVSPRVPILINAMSIQSDLMAAVLEEIRAKQVGIGTTASLQHLLATEPALLVIDDWDRLDDAARHNVDTWLTRLRGTRCSTVVLSRPGSSPPKACSVHYDLPRYSPSERDHSIDCKLGSTTARRDFLRTHGALDELLLEPVLLSAALDAWPTTGAAVEKLTLVALLERGILAQLCSRHSDGGTVLRVLEAIFGPTLTTTSRFSNKDFLQAASTAGAIDGQQLLRELLELNILQQQLDTRLGFSHDLWRLFFLARATASAAHSAEAYESLIEAVSDEDLRLLAPLLLGLVESVETQDRLLRRILHRSTFAYEAGVLGRFDPSRSMAPRVRSAYLYEQLAAGHRDAAVVGFPGFGRWLDPWRMAGCDATDYVQIVGVAREDELAEFGMKHVSQHEPRVVLCDERLRRRLGTPLMPVHGSIISFSATGSSEYRAFGYADVISRVTPLIRAGVLPHSKWVAVDLIVRFAHLYHPRSLDVTLKSLHHWCQQRGDDVFLSRTTTSNGGEAGARRWRARQPLALAGVEVASLIEGTGLDQDQLVRDIALPGPDLPSAGRDFLDQYSPERRAARLQALLERVVPTYIDLLSWAAPILRNLGMHAGGPMRPCVVVSRRTRHPTWWWEPSDSWSTSPSVVIVDDEPPSWDSIYLNIQTRGLQRGRVLSSMSVHDGRMADWSPASSATTELTSTLLADAMSDLSSLRHSRVRSTTLY